MPGLTSSSMLQHGKSARFTNSCNRINSPGEASDHEQKGSERADQVTWMLTLGGWTHACMFACMCLCGGVHVRAHVCVCVHACMCMGVYLLVCMWVWLCMCVVCVYACVHACMWAGLISALLCLESKTFWIKWLQQTSNRNKRVPATTKTFMLILSKIRFNWDFWNSACK